MQNRSQRHLVGQRTRIDMKPQAALHFIALTWLWTDVCSEKTMNAEQEEQSRTALPLLLLLAYPLALSQGGVVPGIPIRRPQDEPTITSTPTAQVAADVPQNVQSDAPAGDANAQIREQFIQGVLQGLQSMAANGAGPTIQPAVLADLLQRVQLAAQSTKAPAVEKEAQSPPINDDSSNDNDPDYDYIDFKNGSRIKYELDNNQQLTDSHYTNKTLQQSAPVAVSYYRPQPLYTFYSSRN